MYFFCSVVHKYLFILPLNLTIMWVIVGLEVYVMFYWCNNLWFSSFTASHDYSLLTRFLADEITDKMCV